MSLSWSTSSAPSAAQAAAALLQLGDSALAAKSFVTVDDHKLEPHHLYVLAVLLHPLASTGAIKKVMELKKEGLSAKEAPLPPGFKRFTWERPPNFAAIPPWSAAQLLEWCFSLDDSPELWVPLLNLQAGTSVTVMLSGLNGQKVVGNAKAAAEIYLQKLRAAGWGHAAQELEKFPEVERLLGMTAIQCRLAGLVLKGTMSEWITFASDLNKSQMTVEFQGRKETAATALSTAHDMASNIADKFTLAHGIITSSLEAICPVPISTIIGELQVCGDPTAKNYLSILCNLLVTSKLKVMEDAEANRGRAAKAEAEKEAVASALKDQEAMVEELKATTAKMRVLGVPDMVHRSAEEERQEKLSPLDFYDQIVDIQQLKDIYNGKGWAVSYAKPESFELFKAKTTAISVSILGDFNVGKSYILTELSGHTFQSGDRVHTIGISIKKVNLGQKLRRGQAEPTVGKQAFFLDTQGLNSPGLGPLPDFSPQKDRHQQHVAHEKWIQEMQAAEEFQRQVILGVADIFFFVVGQLSLKNQKDLLMLHKAITQMKRTKKSFAAQRIFVLHNLREWTHDQFMAHKYMEKIQDHYGRNHLQMECRVEGRFSFLMGKLGTNENDLVKVEHLFLTKAGATNCQNHYVFDFLKKVLEVSTLDNLNMWQRIRGAMAEWLPSYVQVVSSRRSTSPALRLDEQVTTAEDMESDLHHLRQEGKQMAWIRAVPDVESKELPRVSVKCRPLGALVTLASDDLPFNLSECPCRLTTLKGTQCRMLRILSIEVPGLVLENFTCLREAGPTSGTTERIPNLMLSEMEGDDDSLRVELTAELRTTPAAMNQALEDGEMCEEIDGDSPTVPLKHKFSLASNGGVLGMEEYTCRVLDKGTRAIDSGRFSRLVNFQYNFSQKDLKWDNNYDPYYCYRDGVLAIGFVQRGKASPDKIEEFTLSMVSEMPMQPIPRAPEPEAVESAPRPGTARLAASVLAAPHSPGPETEVACSEGSPWIEAWGQ